MHIAELEFLYESELVFPTLEVLHIIGMVIGVGSIAVTDFRFLGLGMRRQNATDLARELLPWTFVGVGLMLLSGTMLFLSDPDLYYLNYVFQIKMALLTAALLFHFLLRDRMIGMDVAGDALTMRGKIAALFSMALWVGVVSGGIFTAFV